MPIPEYTPEELANEEWRDVQGYEGLYVVSNLGRVGKHGEPVDLIGSAPEDGYPTVSLWKNGEQQSIGIHKLVAGAFVANPAELPWVDHKDRNPSNNRATNLRHCTPSQNNANGRSRTGSKSRYRGVSWVESRQRWAASIKKNGKHEFLGHFETEEAAAIVYDQAQRELFGEFAYDNTRTFGLASTVEEELRLIESGRAESRIPRGEAHRCAVITEADVRVIRWHYQHDTATLAEMTKWYGLDAGTLSRIARGEKWKHVPMEWVPNKNNNAKKTIKQFSLAGEFIKEWGSAHEAARALGRSSNANISACCNGRLAHAYGFIWKHSDH